MHRYVVVASRSLLLLVFAACSAVPVEMQDVDFVPVREVAIDEFSGAGALLERFDARPLEQRDEVDAILLAVAVHRDGEVDRRLLWIESAQTERVLDSNGTRMKMTRKQSGSVTVTPKGGEPDTRHYEVTVRPVTVRHSLHDGELVCESRFDMHDECMHSGFWGYASPDATREQSDYGTLFISRLQGLVDEDETLQDLLFLVVDKPSVMSVIANLGVNVGLGWTVPEVDPVIWAESAWPDKIRAGEMRPMQLQIKVNGSPALFGDLLVCEPTGPLIVGGGLCAAVFRHPTDEGRWAIVKLLAVRGS